MRMSTGLGGGKMLRAMGRAVGGVKEAVAAGGGSKGAKSPEGAVSVIPAPPYPSVSASESRGSLSCLVDGDEWENVGEEVEVEEFGEEIGGGGGGAAFSGFSERFVFGQAPTKEEAEDAVSAMQQIFVPVTFSQVTKNSYPSPLNGVVVDEVITSTHVMQSVSSAESDRIDPALHLYSSNNFQSHEHGKVMDAFRLLQINPSIQRMVVALSSDKAVWDAVMKNEVVQAFKKSVYEVGNSEPQASDKAPHNILKRIMDITKGKFMEFFGNINKIVNEMFRSQEMDLFDDVLRSSFMLSVVVFIIVVAARVHRA